MAKNKKSKILAMALCASVMTGIYAAPVMASVEEDVNTLNKITQNINASKTKAGETLFVGKVTADKFGTKNGAFYVDKNGTIKGNSLIIGKNGDNAVFKVDRNGAVKAANGAFTVYKDGKVTATEFTVGGYNLTDIGAKTQGIDHYANDTTYYKGAISATGSVMAGGMGNEAIIGGNIEDGGYLSLKDSNDEYQTLTAAKLGTINDVITEEGAVVSKGDVTSKTADGKTYTLNTIGANTAGIKRIQNGAGDDITVIEDTLRIYDNGTISTANSKFKINNQGTVFANAVNVAENAVVISEDSINAFHNKFTVNTDGVVSTTGINVAKDMFTASAGGVTMASGNMKVDTDGNIILADERTVDGVDVSKLKADFDETNGNVGGITRSEGATAPGTGTTTIEDTLSVSKDQILAQTGSSQFVLNDDVVGMSNGNASVAVINNEVGISAAGNTLVTNAEGSKFKNSTDESYTVINGGNLTISNKTTYVKVDEEGIALTSNGAGLAINKDGLTGNMGNASFNLSNNNYNVTVGNSTVTVNGNGTTFTNGENNGETVINGGSITTETLNVENIKLGNSMTDKDGNTITIGAAGVIDIEKDGNTVFHADTDNFEAHYDNYDLTLDGTNGFVLSNQTTNQTSSLTLDVSGFAFAGPVHLGNGTQVEFSHNETDISLSSLVDRVEDLEQKTTGISFDENTGSTTIKDMNKVDGEWKEGDSSVTVGDNGTTFENGEDNGTTNINGSEIVSDATNVESGSGSGSGFGGGTSTTNGDNAVYVGEDGDYTHVSSDGVTIGDKTNTNTTNIDKDGMVVDGETGNTHISEGGMTVTDKTDNFTTNIDGNGMVVNGSNGTTHISDSGMTVTGDNGTTNISGGDISVDNSVTVAGGSENKTTINNEGITVGDKGTSIKNDSISVGDGGYIGDGDVRSGEGVSLNQTAERVGHLENRVGELEDRIDKVGAMAAAIANLRTMGYDPAAPTEVAVGIGQYRDETGAALGLFHYPNRDFMLSLSVSTSGDEVMGGIGATWKFGRKSPEKVAEIKKAQAEADARRAEEAKLAKAEEMKQAAKEAKIKAQQERHAKLAAERAAQAEAAK